MFTELPEGKSWEPLTFPFDLPTHVAVRRNDGMVGTVIAKHESKHDVYYVHDQGRRYGYDDNGEVSEMWRKLYKDVTDWSTCKLVDVAVPFDVEPEGKQVTKHAS